MSRPDFLAPGPRLAELTTLGVGGRAAALAAPMNDDEVRDALRWARENGRDVLVVGGGSNLLVADADTDAMVLQSADYAIEVTPEDGGLVHLDVGAGVEWDELVAFCVEERFAGLECLSGIPGRVGAAPIQNIGAYGQEVSETIVAVTAVDREDGAPRTFPASACRFGYRTSRFKTDWSDRYVVTRVRFRLQPGGPATARYPELQRALGMADGAAPPPIEEVRRAVLAIRRRKSMVLDDRDPNTRSAGSFFVNPIVPRAEVDAVRERLAARGVDASSMPAYPADDGHTKLSAAWLIERSGFERGFAFGRVGLSTRHCLALVNRGGATASDLVSLASIVRRGVREASGVTLTPEPVFVGFGASVAELLR